MGSRIFFGLRVAPTCRCRYPDETWTELKQYHQERRDKVERCDNDHADANPVNPFILCNHHFLPVGMFHEIADLPQEMRTHQGDRPCTARCTLSSDIPYGCGRFGFHRTILSQVMGFYCSALTAGPRTAFFNDSIANGFSKKLTGYFVFSSLRDCQ
jgi:hypothetical protein